MHSRNFIHTLNNINTEQGSKIHIWLQYDEYDHLSCNILQSGESLMFQRNTLPSSSGSKSKPSMKPAQVGGNLSQSPQLSLPPASTGWLILQP
jgi:hypothetical protein